MGKRFFLADHLEPPTKPQNPTGGDGNATGMHSPTLAKILGQEKLKKIALGGGKVHKGASEDHQDPSGLDGPLRRSSSALGT